MRKTNYSVAKLTPRNVESTTLLSGVLDEEIKIRMNTVIMAESPVKESLIYKRVINSFGLKKLGSRLSPHFKALLNEIENQYSRVKEGNERVFFSGPCEIDYFRATPDARIRYSYQIPNSEAINALLYVIENEGTSDKEELSKAFSEALGYKKQGAKVKALFDTAYKSQSVKNRLSKLK